MTIDPDEQSALELQIERAKAIEAYAQLEHALSGLLAAWLKTSERLAEIVFFKITSARARNAMFDLLFKEQNRPEYKPCWDSLVKLLNGLDGRRNEIVHWTVASFRKFGEPAVYKLYPPAFKAPITAELVAADLVAFQDKADFIKQIVLQLEWVFAGRGEPIGPWPEILLQPLIYPPPEGSPLYQKPKAP